MPAPNYTLSDRLIQGADNALRTLFAPKHGGTRKNPATVSHGTQLPEQDRRLAASLMRVNQSGEVAAQGLYQGHALVVRNRRLERKLDHAADEERDHLNWCTERLEELGTRPSLLNGVWYTGALALGALSGLAGDRWSLGFIAETERQVVAHLENHLQKLPKNDLRSRELLERMRDEEAAHGRDADSEGAAAIPRPVRALMRQAAKIMTTAARWI